MLVEYFLIGMRKGEELKTSRHASAAASRDDRLPHSRQLPSGRYHRVSDVKTYQKLGNSYLNILTTT